MKEALRSIYWLKSKKAAETRLKDLIEIALLSDDMAMVLPHLLSKENDNSVTQ